MPAKPKIECPGCSKLMTVDAARKHKLNPEICITARWLERYHDDQTWVAARKHWRVLELAGLTKQWPIGSPKYWDPINKQWVPSLVFFHVTPKWAFQLAQRLQDDHELAERIGEFELQQRANGRYWKRDKSEKPKKTIKVMAMWLRVRILRAAGRSSMTREMTMDDLETVAIVLRDQ